ncbi:MAG: hypothetical protein ACLP0L_18630 [Solirubrobacteraceae bacterium]
MRLLHCDNADARRLRIAVLAPPWITVPPSGYFGIEALACSTRVIAIREGAVAEIVIDGENGMPVQDEAEMVRAVEQVGSIDPLRWRSSVARRYDISVTPAGYERVYRQATEPEPAHTTLAAVALADADRLGQRRSGR